jgi:hypothetical protein
VNYSKLHWNHLKIIWRAQFLSIVSGNQNSKTSYSPQYGIENEKRGPQDQSKCSGLKEGMSFMIEN